MLNRFLHLVLLGLLLLLMGCDPNIECIEADDWGQQVKYHISARNNDQYEVQPDHTQVGLWNNPGFVLDGTKVVAVVKNSQALESDKTCEAINLDCNNAKGGYCPQNSWTAWFSNWDFNSVDSTKMCQFNRGGWCPQGITMDMDIPVKSVPCLFYRGMGLFAFVADSSSSSPNAFNPLSGSEVCNNSNIENCFVHVGEAALNPPFFDNYCPAGGFFLDPPLECKGGTRQCGLTFKISDRYYSDNAGGYDIVLKQGVKRKSSGVIAKFAQLVTGIICDATKTVYNQIVHENSYRNYIRSLLVLYIAFLGTTFLMGLVNMNHTEFIIRVLKIGLVLQLATSATSWEFFNTHFFSFFTNGVGELTGVLFGEGAAAAAPSTNIGLSTADGCMPNVAGIHAFDEALTKLFSYETTRKIMTLITWKIYGVLYVLAMYVIILVIVYIMIKAVLVFLLSYLALSIIITLAPIFIPFILFKLTRAFFNNWLKQLISYFIQPIIILTFAFFMITMVMNQLQFVFGYRVCWKEWFEIPVLNIKFYSWQSDYDNSSKGCIPTPNAIMEEDENGTYNIAPAPGPNSCNSASLSGSGECMPYECFQDRYIGFPYLDPNDEFDSSRIDELKRGMLMSFDKDLIIMLIMVWFMYKFNTIVPKIAKKLAGGGLDLSKSASGMAKGMGNLAAKGAYGALNPAYRAATGGRDLRKDLNKARRAVVGDRMTKDEIDKEKLEKQRKTLMSELQRDAKNSNISLQEKTDKANKIKELEREIKKLDSNIKTSDKGGSFYKRSLQAGKALTAGAEQVAKSPQKLFTSIPKAVGKRTIGKAVKSAKSLRDTLDKKTGYSAERHENKNNKKRDDRKRRDAIRDRKDSTDGEE